jgi:hypothetical protein
MLTREGKFSIMNTKKHYVKPMVKVLKATATHGKNINKVENNGHRNGTNGASPTS